MGLRETFYFACLLRRSLRSHYRAKKRTKLAAPAVGVIRNRDMRTIILLILLSSSTFGAELTLRKGQGYVVPGGKVWIIKDALAVDCRVCTADVYLRGELTISKLVALHSAGN